MNKFLSITESNNFGSDAEGELVEEQTFRIIYIKFPSRTFLKLSI